MKIGWALACNAGITHVSSGGEKYKSTTTAWTSSLKPQLQYGNYSATGKITWKAKWIETAPTTLDTWEEWTKDAQALGAAYSGIQFYVLGSTGSEDCNCAFEVTSLTLTLSSPNIPQINFGDPDTAYFLQARLTNEETGEWMELQYAMEVDKSLVVDCINHLIVYDGSTNAIGAKTLSSIRNDWLPLYPGLNTILYEEDGLSDVDIDIAYRERFI